MGYKEAEIYIKSLGKRGIVPGLANEEKLLEKLGNPHHTLNFIHIAGTNGKGSVGAYLSQILCADNKRVGRFVSPCVGEYKNTFLINDNPVDEDIVAKSMDIVCKAIGELEKSQVYPTSFEVEVALAFVIFKALTPDYVLLECGMGGKNDATNVIPSPDLAVITKIAMDHTAYLGNTLEDIAKEKTGIIKAGTKVVTLQQNKSAMDAIINRCKEINVPLHIATTPTETDFDEVETRFNINNTQYKTKMLGAYQPQNASIAIKCAEVLRINNKSIYNGIYNSQWKYRFERIGKFILDGAHNPDGARGLAESIEMYFNGKDIAFVCGCFKDKDYRKIAEITAKYPNAVYCIKAPTDRGLDSEILCNAFREYSAIAFSVPTLDDAIKKASNHEYVLVFGSLSILHNAKEIIEGKPKNATLQ